MGDKKSLHLYVTAFLIFFWILINFLAIIVFLDALIL